MHAELGRSRRVFESPILTDAVMVAVAYQLFLEAGLHSQRAASQHRLFFVVRLARPQVSPPPRVACVRTRDKAMVALLDLEDDLLGRARAAGGCGCGCAA